MTITRPRRFTRRRTMLLLAGIFVLFAVLAAVANPLVTAISGRSIGAHLAERDGHVEFDRYDTADQLPAGVLPSWFPPGATGVTVVRPGPKSGLEDTVRIDATVPDGERLPAFCAPSDTWSMPFIVPNDWPEFSVEDLQTCEGWTVAARPGHVYLWGSSSPGGTTTGKP